MVLFWLLFVNLVVDDDQNDHASPDHLTILKGLALYFLKKKKNCTNSVMVLMKHKIQHQTANDKLISAGTVLATENWCFVASGLGFRELLSVVDATLLERHSLGIPPGWYQLSSKA